MDRQYEIERLIVDLREQGPSYPAIGKELENKGILTLRGKSKWDSKTIQRIYNRVSGTVNQSGQDVRQSQKKSDRQQNRQYDIQKKKTEDRQINRQAEIQSKEVISKMAERLKLLESHVDQLQTELTLVRQEIDSLKTGHDIQGKSRQKKGLSIEGWNAQNADGYYRLFKRINGKMQCIYLGKVWDKEKARKRIKEKEAALNDSI